MKCAPAWLSSSPSSTLARRTALRAAMLLASRMLTMSPLETSGAAAMKPSSSDRWQHGLAGNCSPSSCLTSFANDATPRLRPRAAVGLVDEVTMPNADRRPLRRQPLPQLLRQHHRAMAAAAAAAGHAQRPLAPLAVTGDQAPDQGRRPVQERAAQ